MKPKIPDTGLARPRMADYKALIRLGAPVMVTQLGVITVSFADTIMVGRYGLEELAASAFVNSFFLVPLVMIIGFAGGVTPLAGALYSRGDNHGVGRLLRGSLRVNLQVAIAMTAIMGILWFFLDAMGQPVEIMPLVKQYYLIILFTLVPQAVFSCCQQVANGTTDTASPMWVVLGTNILNIAGNYALIFGHFGAPELGLAGAGYSTLFSRLAGCLAMLWIVGCSGRYRRYREGFGDGSRYDGLLVRIWKTSFPVMIQSGVECLLWSFGAVVCGWFGKVQIAAYQVVNTIGQLGFMLFMSFGVAVSIRVANFTGVSDLAGIRRTTSAGLILNFILAAAASLIFLLAGARMLEIFTESREVVASGVLLIWPLILYQFCDAAQLTLCNAQRGTSKASPLLYASLISYIAVGIPTMLVMAKTLDMGNLGVYYSFSLALAAMALSLALWFKKTLRGFEKAWSVDKTA